MAPADAFGCISGDAPPYACASLKATGGPASTHYVHHIPWNTTPPLLHTSTPTHQPTMYACMYLDSVIISDLHTPLQQSPYVSSHVHC